MLQIRLKEGSGNEKRWFNPSRDLVNCWPSLLRNALRAQDEFQGNESCTREQMIECGGELGKLIVRIVKTPVSPDDAQKGLKEIEAKYPGAMTIIKHTAFHTLHGAFATWVLDAKPKTDDDASIPVIGLDDIAERIARGANKP